MGDVMGGGGHAGGSFSLSSSCLIVGGGGGPSQAQGKVVAAVQMTLVTLTEYEGLKAENARLVKHNAELCSQIREVGAFSAYEILLMKCIEVLEADVERLKKGAQVHADRNQASPAKLDAPQDNPFARRFKGGIGSACED